MSDHIRDCGKCKSKLYSHDPAILSQTISTYLKPGESNKKKSFFQMTKFLVPVSTLAVLLIGIFSIVFYLSNGPNQPASIVQVSEKPETPKTATSKEIVPENNDGANKTGSTPRDKTSGTKSRRTIRKNSRPIKRRKSSKPSKVAQNRSANRAAAASSITGLSPYFETIKEVQPTFRWKRVKNAIKYHLYVSDTSQILIEEAEIKKANSYKLKTKLKPGKAYRWKVIATITDGKTVVGKSIDFSVRKAGKISGKN